MQFVDPAAGIFFAACSKPVRGVFAAGGSAGFGEGASSSAVAFVETIAYEAHDDEEDGRDEGYGDYNAVAKAGRT